MKYLLLLCLLVGTRIGSSRAQVGCQNLCSYNDAASGDWKSRIALSSVTESSVVVSWSPDPVVADAQYVVQFKEQNSKSTNFNSSLPTTTTSYRIINLMPLTDYEVQICRMEDTNRNDNCGFCLMCFSTDAAKVPPDVPVQVKASSISPEIVSVRWEAPESLGAPITNYSVDWVLSSSGALVGEDTVEPPDTRLTVFDLMPNTNYTFSVVASNQYGTSEPGVVAFKTSPRVDQPGVLLMGFDSTLYCLTLTETTITSAATAFGVDNWNMLYSSTSNIIGADFHFQRREIFITTGNREVTRLDVAITSDNDMLHFLQDEVVVIREADLGAITVDWINNHLYWVEYSSTTNLVRADIDGSSPCCVYSLESGHNISLSADPLHGYIYWSSQSGLIRVPMGDVQGACTCMSYNEDPIVSDASFSHFTLELPESKIVYVGVSGINSVSLSLRNQENEISVQGDNVISALASFSNARMYAWKKMGSWIVVVFRVEATGVIDLPTQPNFFRTMRQVLQPLPVPPSPPTNVRVFTTSTEAFFNWSAPEYQEDFFGDSAFRQWTYTIKYSLLGSMDEVVFNTTELMATLTNLNPGSLYEMSISVSGPGGELMAEEALVFSTELPGTATQILVGADEGVIQANVDGTSASIIGGIYTSATNGIAYDTWSRVFYWIIRGGQSTVFTSTDPNTSNERLYEQRDNPLSLKLDWITQKLYWIEQSESVIVRASALSDTAGIPEPEVVLHSPPITALAIDSLHGVLFYISGDTIYMKTLNGLMDQLTCVSSTVTPTAIAVDSVESVLYWIHGREEFTTINSLHYSEQSCDESVHSIDVFIAPAGFNSEGGLEYYSGKLYISDFNSDKVYTVAANISAIEMGQTLAIGRIGFANVEFGSIRDIAFTSNSTQQLPDGLIADMRGNVAPSTPGSPPQLDPLSTSTNIIVTWSPSDQLPFSPIWYKLSYTTGASSEMKSIISSGTSVTLTDMLSPYTSVLASVTAYSLWSASEPTENATFFTPPEVPGPVNTVRAYVYNPMRGASNITALVVWDGLTHLEAGGIVTSYTINLFKSGVLEAAITLRDNSTEAVLEERLPMNILYYPLIANTAYSVTVSGRNSAGEGPQSEPFLFTVSGPSPPEEVVVFGSSGAEVVGLDGMQSSDLQEVTAPLTVNTIEREVYWYSNQTLYRKSIDGGIEVALVSSSHASTLKSLFPVAFAYEWVGHAVYMAALRDGHFTLWRVPIQNPDGFELVYEDFETYHEEQIKVALTVDPFKGLAYWLDVAQGVLYKLNLTNPTAAETLTAAGGRRKRAGSLQEVDLAPALTLDSASGLLWVSDASTGDILTCSVTSNMCGVEVSASAFSGQAEIGLPATSIALDEKRIYWTKNGSEGVFYVDRASQTVLMRQLDANALLVFSTSPGIQPLPPLVCLSPDLVENQLPNTIRPTARQIANSNTSVTVEWDEPALPPECSGVTYSFPPLEYILELRLGETLIAGYPIATYNTEYTLTGLQPYTEYELKVSASNQYTMARFYFHYDEMTGMVEAFGPDVDVMTSEGVPLKPVNVTAIPKGTREAAVSWDGPYVPHDGLIVNELRGDPNNLLFFVYVGEDLVETTNITEIIVHSLVPGTINTIMVQTSNGVFESELVSVEVLTWALPPAPTNTSSTNYSISATFVLETKHFEINLIYLRVWEETHEDEVYVSENQTVASESGQVMSFTVGYVTKPLKAFTVYNVEAVATYLNNELDNGKIFNITTGVGVPESPVIMLVDNGILKWSEPRSNGAIITSYIVNAMLDSETQDEENEMSLPSSQRELDLTKSEELLKQKMAQYIIRVFARNEIGHSKSSNTILVTRTDVSGTGQGTDPSSAGPSTAIVIGSACAAAAVLVCIVLFVLCFLYCCVLPGTRRKRMRLSVLYGPDNELTNLRAYARTQAAHNPHYTWCQDDYVCTDEDLQQLNRFPRQLLKLEKFIDRGEFGEVYQGTAFDITGQSTGPTPVAVKTMRKGSTPDEQKKFLSEAALMSNFDHPNIVKVLGICVDNDPVYIIMELMPGGDLLKFLRDAKREHGPPLLTVQEQIQIALDVSQGCRYLEQQHFIHRDIAARNCLVSSRGADRVVKMGDFGLAKDLYSSDYYQVEGQRKLPVRWMAPEALLQGKFAIESDVWSYGVLLWEIMTLGNQPYPGRTNQEVLQFVTGGGRLDRPERCPGKLYHLMQSCWKRYTSQRPQFVQVVEIVSSLLEYLRRDSVYSDESDEESLERSGSKKSASRTPSIRSGIMSLARQGSAKFRNSLRHSSMHRRDFTAQDNQNNV